MYATFPSPLSLYYQYKAPSLFCQKFGSQPLWLLQAPIAISWTLNGRESRVHVRDRTFSFARFRFHGEEPLMQGSLPRGFFFVNIELSGYKALILKPQAGPC